MDSPSTSRYWIHSVSHGHGKLAKQGGFVQADHGRSSKLQALSKGDFLVFYSPRTRYREGEPLQMFTALGMITDDEPFQVEMKPDFHPWRRAMKFLRSRNVAIHGLLDELSFITDKEKWGLPFRQGLFEVEHVDFERIALAMGVREDFDA